MTASGDKRTELLAPAPRAVTATTADELVPGELAGHWRIASLIAHGGCGTVYAARHQVLDRLAAVKVLHAVFAAAPAMVERFVREARAVNHIRHPNLVDIFDFGNLADGRPYFVMELLAADDLEQRIAATGRLTLGEILAILGPIGGALAAAHRAGYIHRDLKARNIGFAAAPDGREIPKLLDFGIAKLLPDPERPGTTGTLRAGTPHCMAPEQIRGERVDARTDIYALGVLLHHMLTGHYPFDADDSVEVERLHLEAPPPAPSRLAPVSAALDTLVARALAKDPAARPATVTAFLEELAAAAGPRAVRREPAVAIRIAAEIADRFDDADLAEAAAAIERAAVVLADHGYAAVLATGTSVLAARLAGGDPDPRVTATALARSIERSLTERPEARRAVAFRASVHAAPAEIAIDTGAFVGGPLLDVHAWDHPRRESSR